MTDDAPAPADGRRAPRRPPRFHGPHTWALAKEQYLSGEAAKTVCERFGIGFDAFKRRMQVEGWTRRAYAAATDPARPRRRAPGLGGTAEPPTVAAPAPAGPPPDLSAAELARWTVRQAGQALREGRTADARALSAMAESLSRTAAREPKTSLETILRALTDPAFQIELFRIDPDNPDDPDLPVKKVFWGRSPDSQW